MIETILEFERIQQELPKKINDSKYKASHFIKELGLTSSTFYRKVSAGKFTAKEMLKIIELINPKEYYRWEFEREVEAAEYQVKKGETLSNVEVEELLTK